MPGWGLVGPRIPYVGGGRKERTMDTTTAATTIIAATGATGPLAAEIEQRWAHTHCSIEGLAEWAKAVEALQEPRLIWARDVRGTDAVCGVWVHCRRTGVLDFGLHRAGDLIASAVREAAAGCRLRYRHATAGGARREARDRARIEAAFGAALATWVVLAADAIARVLGAEVWHTQSLDRYVWRGYTVGLPRDHYGECPMDRSRPVTQAARLRAEADSAVRRRRLDSWRGRLLAIGAADVRVYVGDRLPAGSADSPTSCSCAVNRAGYLLGILAHHLGIEEHLIRESLPRSEDVEADEELTAHAETLRRRLMDANDWSELAA